jgi:hypothetical protein
MARKLPSTTRRQRRGGTAGIRDARRRRPEIESGAASNAGGADHGSTMPEAAAEGGAMPSGSDDGLAISDMPGGQMASGQTTGAGEVGGMVGMMTTDMPRGEMRRSPVGEMPSAGMTAPGMAAGTTDTAADSGMPAGQMAGGEAVANVGAIQLPGEWRLILVPASTAQ